MGDKSLMIKRKTLFSILVAVPGLLLADLSIKQMDSMVTKVKAKRAGLEIKHKGAFVSPFVILKKDTNATSAKLEKPRTKVVEFNLGAIINNRAFVNKKWVSKGETVDGYKVTALNENGVTLKKEKHVIELFLKKSKPIFTLAGSK